MEKAVTIDDFAKLLPNLINLIFLNLKLWYSQAGTPMVEVLKVMIQQKNLTLTLKQSCPKLKTSLSKTFFIFRLFCIH